MDMATQLMGMATGLVMAIRLMAMDMGLVTAIRLMAMDMGPVTAIRFTGLTELPIAPLSDAISTPLLSVSIVIAIGTNAVRVRALADMRGAYAFAVGPTPFLLSPSGEAV
jgi:hypothetical protein